MCVISDKHNQCLMQHVGPQYGQGALPTSHQSSSYVAHEPTTQQNCGSTTSSLRQWRKKDASAEKQSQQQQTNVSDSTTTDNPSHIARVAPHTHYPPRPNEVYRYPTSYTEYNLGYKEPSPTPVKYSEIVENPPPSIQHLDHLPPVIQKHKENKDYMEMCSMQPGHLKQAYPEAMKPTYTETTLTPPQYMPKDPQLHQYVQKESQMHQSQFQQYLQKYGMQHSQYPPRNYPGEPPNNFLATLNKINPRIAQSIINDPHIRDAQVGMYQEQTRAYQHSQRMFHPSHMHGSPNYTGHIHHRNMSQAYNYPPQSYGYKHPETYNRMSQFPQMSKYHHQQDYKINSHMEQPPRNISPRRTYTENISMPINYAPVPSKVSPPNYSQCSQLEYAQHYQHRRNQMQQEYFQQNYKNSYLPPNHQMGGESSEIRTTASNRIKQFLENWVDEDVPGSLPDIIVSNNPADVEKLQLVKRPVRIKEDGTQLFVLGSTEIPHENVAHFLHLQQIEKLGGFYESGVISENAARYIIKNPSEAVVIEEAQQQQENQGNTCIVDKIVNLHIVENNPDKQNESSTATIVENDSSNVTIPETSEKEETNIDESLKNMPIIEVGVDATDSNQTKDNIYGEMEKLHACDDVVSTTNSIENFKEEPEIDEEILSLKATEKLRSLAKSYVHNQDSISSGNCISYAPPAVNAAEDHSDRTNDEHTKDTKCDDKTEETDESQSTNETSTYIPETFENHPTDDDSGGTDDDHVIPEIPKEEIQQNENQETLPENLSFTNRDIGAARLDHSSNDAKEEENTSDVVSAATTETISVASTDIDVVSQENVEEEASNAPVVGEDVPDCTTSDNLDTPIENDANADLESDSQEEETLDPNEVQIKNALKIDNNNVLLHIADELVEVKVSVNAEGQKVVSVVLLTGATILETNENVGSEEKCSVENCNEESENLEKNNSCVAECAIETDKRIDVEEKSLNNEEDGKILVVEDNLEKSGEECKVIADTSAVVENNLEIADFKMEGSENIEEIKSSEDINVKSVVVDEKHLEKNGTVEITDELIEEDVLEFYDSTTLSGNEIIIGNQETNAEENIPLEFSSSKKQMKPKASPPKTKASKKHYDFNMCIPINGKKNTQPKNLNSTKPIVMKRARIILEKVKVTEQTVLASDYDPKYASEKEKPQPTSPQKPKPKKKVSFDTTIKEIDEKLCKTFEQNGISTIKRDKSNKNNKTMNGTVKTSRDHTHNKLQPKSAVTSKPPSEINSKVATTPKHDVDSNPKTVIMPKDRSIPKTEVTHKDECIPKVDVTPKTAVASTVAAKVDTEVVVVTPKIVVNCDEEAPKDAMTAVTVTSKTTVTSDSDKTVITAKSDVATKDVVVCNDMVTPETVTAGDAKSPKLIAKLVLSERSQSYDCNRQSLNESNQKRRLSLQEYNSRKRQVSFSEPEKQSASEVPSAETAATDTSTVSIVSDTCDDIIDKPLSPTECYQVKSQSVQAIKRPLINSDEFDIPTQSDELFDNKCNFTSSDDEIKQCKEVVDMKLKTLELQLPKMSRRDFSERLERGSTIKKNDSLMRRFLNRESLTIDEVEKVKEIIKCKRVLEEISKAKLMKQVNKDNMEYKQLSYDLKSSVVRSSSVVDVKLNGVPESYGRRRKRFRNLYTERDSDADDTEDIANYSVHQSKNQDGVPKIIIKRKFSEYRSSYMQPVVRLERLPSLDMLAKRRKIC